MLEHEKALEHFLKWMPLQPEYIGKHAIPAYFQLCPWAEPLIGPQLREAYRATLHASIPPGYGMATNVAKVKK